MISDFPVNSQERKFMKLAFIQTGLPGPAYHGGAVTCWAILKAMKAMGHDVTLISLFDNSKHNPYLDSRDSQTKAIEELGVKIRFIDFDFSKIAFKPDGLFARLKLYAFPPLSILFPWAKLSAKVAEAVKSCSAEAAFCYHFDALSACYQIKDIPLVAGVGDLWHLPSYFLWLAKDSSLRKFLLGWPMQKAYEASCVRLMRRMLLPCSLKGAFAAHYADFLKNLPGLEKTVYFRTPAHDPVGESWLEQRKDAQMRRNSTKPKILMIGDITGTAARWGLRLLVDEVLPHLDQVIGSENYELHLVGGGQIESQFDCLHKHPAVFVRGRITPPDEEFLNSDVLFVPTPITLGIRVRIITGLSYGCCVVAHEANRAGIPELAHNVNSLTGKTGKELAEHIVTAIQNPEIRQRIEKSARDTFCSLFSETVAAKTIVKSIENLKRD